MPIDMPRSSLMAFAALQFFVVSSSVNVPQRRRPRRTCAGGKSSIAATDTITTAKMLMQARHKIRLRALPRINNSPGGYRS